MPPPLLLLITGLPCTGKTKIGERLARTFSLPLLTKDGIKVLLFDTLGWSDRAWSKKLSEASNCLLLHFAEALLAAGQSLILESNFPPQEFTPRFRLLAERCAFRPVQILCVAEGEELVERFRRRWESGARHPGHVDDQSFEEIRQTLLAGRLAPLEIGGPLIEVETTEFDKIDYKELVEEIRRSGA
jgi:predicted kinase